MNQDGTHYRIPKPEPRKNDILAVQIRAPDDLQKFVGKKVLRRATGTKDNRIYNVADENRKFDGLPGGNPAAKIAVPPKRKGRQRLAFTDDAAIRDRRRGGSKLRSTERRLNLLRQ